MIDPNNFFLSKDDCEYLDDVLTELLNYIGLPMAAYPIDTKRPLEEEDICVIGLYGARGDRLCTAKVGTLELLKSYGLVFERTMNFSNVGYDHIHPKATYFISSGGFKKVWNENHKQQELSNKALEHSKYALIVTTLALFISPFLSAYFARELSATTKEYNKVKVERDVLKSKYDSLQKEIYHFNQPTSVLKAKSN